MKQLKKSILDHYTREDVLINIARQSYNREFALLCPAWAKKNKLSIRMLKIQNVDGLRFILNAIKFYTGYKPYNFYKSLAQYPYGIPNQSINLEERKALNLNKRWYQIHQEKMKSYDLVLDLDSPNHNELYNTHEAMKCIHKFYNKFDVPHYVMFSGKGFHLYTPYECTFPLRNRISPSKSKTMIAHKPDNLYINYSKIARYFRQFFRCVDKFIYDSRRLIKLAYTVSLYSEDKGYVSCWLNRESEIEKFHLPNYEVDNFVLGRNLQPKLFNRRGDLGKLMKEVINNGEKKEVLTPNKRRIRKRR